MSTISVSTIISVATGTINTNVLNVTTGQGASFSAGYGVVSSFGTSFYVGVIQSISTDALTVYPTLPFGISGTIYRYFQAGQSLSINPTLNILNYTFGSTELSRTGFTSAYLDPAQNFAVWGTNIGYSIIDSAGGVNQCLTFATAAGFFQCEGYFSAAEIEWYGMSFSVLSGTMVVNGLPVYNHNNIGFTGVLKKSVFVESGPGWNNFAFFPGSSHINVGVARINLYGRSRDISASYGILASFDTLQAFVPRSANATLVAPGTFRRVYADQVLFKGPWVRVTGSTLPGGVAYVGSTTTCTANFQYYGTHFAAIGGSFGVGGSMNLSLDAAANQGSTSLNVVIQGTSTTFHSVSLAILGGTNIISGFDYFRPIGEMKNLQIPSLSVPTNTQYVPPSSGQPRSEVYVTTGNGYGSTNTTIRKYSGTPKVIGGDITYVPSAANGDSFVVNVDGVYCFTRGEQHSAGSETGMSRNSPFLTVDINTTSNDPFRLLWSDMPGATHTNICVTCVCRAGDVIRPHDNGNNASTGVGDSWFRAVKVSS